MKIEEEGTRGKASGERECRREMSSGGTRHSESISSRRSPHSQCHEAIFFICSSFEEEEVVAPPFMCSDQVLSLMNGGQ